MSKTDRIDCGAVNILSVGEGHIRLSFDDGDPAEKIRAARIVKDMLRRGYALLIATKADGGTVSWSRAKAFDEATSEYIIVDYDPLAEEPEEPDRAIVDGEQSGELPPPRRPGRPRGATKRVPAAKSEAISVGRTAGG